MDERVPPEFSVVIPAYNYGRYLVRAVESVEAQRGPSYEIIVVDDGSTDETPEVAAGLGTRIEYIRQANAGVAAARNAGLEQARGRYVIFLDADDRMAEGALAAFHEIAVQSPMAVTLLGGYCSVDQAGLRSEKGRLPTMTEPRQNFRRYIQREFTIASGMAAVRQDGLEGVRFPVGVTNGEDVVFFGQLLARFGCVSFDAVVVEMFDHAARARRDFSRHLKNGTRTVDVLFQPDRLPAELLPLRPVFESRWLLSLGRAALQGGDRKTARHCYLQVLRLRGRDLLNWKQFGRLMRSCWPSSSV